MIADAIILSCIAILSTILFFLALTAICWLVRLLAVEEECECSDYDPTFKPKFLGQKDTPK